MTTTEMLCKFNAAEFARRRLRFEADPVQRRVLEVGVRRGILCCTRQWGKTTVSAIKALHHAWFRAGSLVLVASPSARQSAIFVRKVREFARALDVRPRGAGDNRVSLVLPNGSRVVGLPDREGTTRGFSNPDLLMIDEASRVTDEAYDSLVPSHASGTGALWLLSTPSGKRGFFWKEWQCGGPEWRRISVSAPECPRISKQFLEDVEEVYVREARDVFRVFTIIADDADDLCDAIYDRERDLIREFSEARFDFNIIARRGRSLSDIIGPMTPVWQRHDWRETSQVI